MRTVNRTDARKTSGREVSERQDGPTVVEVRHFVLRCFHGLSYTRSESSQLKCREVCRDIIVFCCLRGHARAQTHLTARMRVEF
jgi:hypothetical protein